MGKPTRKQPFGSLIMTTQYSKWLVNYRQLLVSPKRTGSTKEGLSSFMVMKIRPASRDGHQPSRDFRPLLRVSVAGMVQDHLKNQFDRTSEVKSTLLKRANSLVSPGKTEGDRGYPNLILRRELSALGGGALAAFAGSVLARGVRALAVASFAAAGQNGAKHRDARRMTNGGSPRRVPQRPFGPC